jgi:hypothetical protein
MFRLTDDPFDTDRDPRRAYLSQGLGNLRVTYAARLIHQVFAKCPAGYVVQRDDAYQLLTGGGESRFSESAFRRRARRRQVHKKLLRLPPSRSSH